MSLANDMKLPQPSTRLVRVKKRKALSVLSAHVTAGDQENRSPAGHLRPSTKRLRIHEDARPTPPPSTSTQTPLEWGLKTKVRFVSTHSFDWAQARKARQESLGMAAFLHKDTSFGPMDSVSELQSHLMYWEHPAFPSLSPFSTSDPKQRVGLTALRETPFSDALKEDWSSSFRSVFQQFRLGACPYFYLCAYHFSTLFLTSNGGPPAALISPTTSGLRKALKREGVEFSLPLDVRKVNDQEGSLHEPLESESDDECSSWLSNMIGQNGMPFSKKINTRPSGDQTSIDSRPESTILIASTSLQSLFNYLLNCKTLTAPTGPLADLPPTILSPVAFKGGTLRTLKTAVGSISEESGCGLVRKQYLDIKGPILPHTLRNLSTLISRTQQDNVRIHSVVSEFTRVFSQATSATTWR